METEKRNAITGYISDRLGKYSLLAFGCTAAAYLIWQLFFRFNNHIRRISSFGDSKQRYFVSAHETFAWFKEHIIYAPLFRTRHNQEFQLSRAINMGNLPSRVHGLLTVGLVGMNIIMCVMYLPYSEGGEAVASAVVSRTGTLATINLIPLMIMVGRNNPLISILHVPFDTWNLLHRWLGRVVVLEAIAHTLAWAINKGQKKGWDIVGKSMEESFIWNGLIVSFIFTLTEPSLLWNANKPLTFRLPSSWSHCYCTHHRRFAMPSTKHSCIFTSSSQQPVWVDFGFT